MGVIVEKRTDVLDKSGLDRRLRKMNADIDRAKVKAANTATRVSLKTITHKRAIAPPRPGRNQERIEKVLKWYPVANENAVSLNSQDLNKRAKHWIIQEIGTNRSAFIYVGPDRIFTRTIPSQKGRRISSGLVWATKGGELAVPGSSRNQQLFLRSKVEGAPGVRRHVRTSDDIASRRVSTMRIRKEIPGQGFVQAGGKAGFREYRKSVLAAARSQFRRGSR